MDGNKGAMVKRLRTALGGLAKSGGHPIRSQLHTYKRNELKQCLKERKASITDEKNDMVTRLDALLLEEIALSRRGDKRFASTQGISDLFRPTGPKQRSFWQHFSRSLKKYPDFLLFHNLTFRKSLNALYFVVGRS